MRLHDSTGNRPYLNAEGRAVLLGGARRSPARDDSSRRVLHVVE
jgi:hypothetical protein